jgi:hypothetical protein
LVNRQLCKRNYFFILIIKEFELVKYGIVCISFINVKKNKQIFVYHLPMV